MTSPAGILSKPDGALKTLLSESSSWRTWTGAADAAAALAFIHLIRRPAAATRPFALIDWGGSFRSYGRASGAGTHFQREGDLILIVEDDVDPTEVADANAADAEYSFRNNLGALIADIEDLAAVDTKLDVTGIDVLNVSRSHPDERVTLGDYYQAVLLISWGVR